MKKKEANDELVTNFEEDWFDEDTFDEVRKVAMLQGYNTIYFLFDEAQGLFSGNYRKDVANKLKVLMEEHWGNATTDMASIRIGLVGQNHLPRLIAGQLDAFFPKSYSRSIITEDQILYLLKRIIKGLLQSSSSARNYLSEISSSIFVLREVLEDLYRRLQQVHRTWFIHSDVESSVESLISRAVLEPSNKLVAYLRDPLNASDDLTNWRKRPKDRIFPHLRD